MELYRLLLENKIIIDSKVIRRGINKNKYLNSCILEVYINL